MYLILTLAAAGLIVLMMMFTSTKVGKKYEKSPALNAVALGLCLCAIVSSCLLLATVDLIPVSC